MPLFHDRAGRFSPERTLALIAVALPLVWLLWQAATPGASGHAGVDPVPSLSLGPGIGGAGSIAGPGAATGGPHPGGASGLHDRQTGAPDAHRSDTVEPGASGIGIYPPGSAVPDGSAPAGIGHSAPGLRDMGAGASPLAPPPLAAPGLGASGAGIPGADPSGPATPPPETPEAEAPGFSASEPGAPELAPGPGLGGPGLLGPGLLGPAGAGVSALGARPLSAAIHFSGLWALRFLWLSLAVTPLRRLFDWPKLFFARRILGLGALFYALLHLGLFAVDQGLGRALSEVALRFYLLIGAVAAAGLLALGATSFNAAIKRLGSARWNRLHSAAYPIAVLACAHFFVQSKLDVSQPVAMAGLLTLLFAYRAAFRWKGAVTPLGFGLLVVASAGATVLIEMAWYGLATRVDPWRVLEANVSFVLGPSPAWWVLAVGLPVAGLAALRQRVAPAATRRRPLRSTGPGS